MSNIIDKINSLPSLSREERKTIMAAREKKMDLVFGDRDLAAACAKLNEIDREMQKILNWVELEDVFDRLDDRKNEINKEIEELEDEKESCDKIINIVKNYQEHK